MNKFISVLLILTLCVYTFANVEAQKLTDEKTDTFLR